MINYHLEIYFFQTHNNFLVQEKLSRTHILGIKDRLDSIVKTTNQSITDYVQAIKACTDQLSLMGKPVDPEDIIAKVLRGLDYNQYKPVIDAIRARD